ncbi:MAG: SRPBCC family protein [Chloroflexota bacterium]|nr:SRPBCC family protein [Chloroflexota bacterium]
MRASSAIAFELAAQVERWPRILPHYERVRVLRQMADGGRLVEMAARRDLLPVPGPGVPLRWTALQTLHPTEPRVAFEHVAGPTRGMRVAWTFTPIAHGQLEIQIRHVFEPRWPLPRPLVDLVVGQYFVNGVAARTLRRIGELAEARTLTAARLLPD